jgi:regulator of protease activity HflC (stomatin/prohibitin superfamily)
MNIMFPGLDRLADQDTIREKVMDIPPQNCITRDNVRNGQQSSPPKANSSASS